MVFPMQSGARRISRLPVRLTTLYRTRSTSSADLLRVVPMELLAREHGATRVQQTFGVPPSCRSQVCWDLLPLVFLPLAQPAAVAKLEAWQSKKNGERLKLCDRARCHQCFVISAAGAGYISHFFRSQCERKFHSA